MNLHLCKHPPLPRLAVGHVEKLCISSEFYAPWNTEASSSLSVRLSVTRFVGYNHTKAVKFEIGHIIMIIMQS